MKQTPFPFRFSGLPALFIIPFLLPVLVILMNSGFADARAGDDTSRQDLTNDPIQITSRTEAVLDMAVSADGAYIVYASGDNKPVSLWLASADPGEVILPEKLAGGSSVKSSPAISPDSRYVAYVDTDFDVKGDIYLIDRQIDPKDADARPLRLTDRTFEDGSPFFSGDGRFLYFHRAAGNQPRSLFAIDLKNRKKPPMAIMTGGDAMTGALSPDGKKLAFVSTRDGASGDIFILQTDNQTIRQITRGPAIDMFPAWHPDSRMLYFSRIGSDTTHDGEITPEDRSVVCRINTEMPDSIPFPVTPLSQVAFKPYPAAGRIYFLSSRAGVSNCWAVPEEGFIRTAKTAAAQLNSAEIIAGRIPYDPYIYLLACIRVIEKFPDQAAVAAAAGFRAGSLFQELNLPVSASGAFQFVRTNYADVLPESALSAIRQITIEFQTTAAATRTGEKQDLLDKSIGLLDRLGEMHPGIIAAEAHIESAALLVESDGSLTAMTEALDRLDRVLSLETADNGQKAHALFLKAQVYKITAPGDPVVDTLRSIITGYPEERKWVDMAVDHIIGRVLADFAAADTAKKIQELNQLAANNRRAAPPLAMGALNRIGDLYYASGDLVQAKAAYQNVLDAYPALTTQTAAARLSLAEILYREERFRAAIDLYEQEISLRDAGDRIYQLARQGYIRKNISAGEFYYRLGEIPSARSLFKELIDYDDTIVEAHRGYIKCAAVSGDIETVLARYRKDMTADPENPVRIYCTGLCLTYLNTEDAAQEARKLIAKAIRYNSGIAYFHQTLGYVHEVLETVYNRRGQLELALMAYQKAYFLTDNESNSENAANLELNLGNIYYLMGQYGKAYDFYALREKREIAFSDATTRIVFLKRYGECAFQNNEIARTIDVFRRAANEIDRHIDPLAPAHAFDKLKQYINNQIITPAGNHETTQALSDALARRQSAQNLRAADLSAAAAAPPSVQWLSYKAGMSQLLEQQRSINKDAAELAAKYNQAVSEVPGSLPITDAERNLDHLTRQIKQAMAFPERLVTLKAEISDRLGLAYQENQDFEEAAEIFDQVFSINERSENFANLARNRRSAAYNRYMLAGTVTGDQRTRLLEQAADVFHEVLSLIEQYGVPAPREKEKTALIDISLSTSLDAAGTTEAAKGFSEIQEIRLAKTFISRIQLELGDLETARTMLENQLANYPDPDKIRENDLFGVSLLYHRAGLMENAAGDFSVAFKKFADSANLCLKLKNPVSAAQNLMNMAAAGHRWCSRRNDPVLTETDLNLLQSIDRRVIDLLNENTDMTGVSLLMRCHNLLGVFYAGAGDFLYPDSPETAPNMEDMARKITVEQVSVGHFTRGIALFEKQSPPRNRDDLEIAASLHLNLAAVSEKLGDWQTAVKNYKTALTLSDIGVFPDLKWLALTGLGDLEQALLVLETVPLSRAGCLPGEITTGFAPLVLQQLAADETEAALHLCEKISELERFHRLAPYIRPQNGPEKSFFEALFPRLSAIRALEQELAGADENRRAFIKQRLDDEKSLLADYMGPENENLPAPFKDIADKGIRDLAVFLMSLDIHIENTAMQLADINLRLQNDKNPAETDQNQARELSQTYDDAVRQYFDLCRDAYYARPLASPPDFITLLGPEPFDLMDLSEILTDDDAVARIVPITSQGFPCAIFVITRDDMSGFTAQNADQLKQIIKREINWTTPYIAGENPFATGFAADHPFALSAKHLERCINNRKPFKTKLMAVPKMPFPAAVAQKYDIASDAGDRRFDPDHFSAALSSVNTLLLTGGPVLSATVPIEPGRVSRNFFAIHPDDAHRIALEKLLARSNALSLSIIENMSTTQKKTGPDGSLQNSALPDTVFLLGHLFSIYGCPSLIFANTPEPHPSPAFDILDAYAETSGMAALKSGTPSGTLDDGLSADRLLFLGYQGMDKTDAAKFARSNFVTYVKNGRTAFDKKNYSAAAVFFENAIAIANEIPAYDPYLPDLYKYGRESAYLAGHMDQALGFAGDLADLLGDMAPETKDHAEALLRLGLMHAKKDNYEQAVPIIERAVAIMSALPPDEDLVRAVMELGIVLENATSYDTALSRFKAAADLSRTLNQDELLAAQHLNIGRVYDLRLNQYAAAIQSYEKALEIYTASDDVEKIAESRLNIGRCWRLLGNFAEADRCYEESLALIAEKAPDLSMMKAKILIEKANNAWFQGLYEEAFSYQRQCHAISEQEDFPLMRVLSQNTEGLIWWTLGNYDKALAVLDNALINARSLKIRKDEIATTLNNMGLIYRDRGDFQKAVDTFDQAIAIDTEIGSKWGIAYDYRNKALTLLKLDRPGEAADLFDQAYEISTSIGNRINAAKAILGKGLALFALENYPAAESAFETARTLSESMMIRETQWRALFGLARVRIVFSRDLDGAETLLREAIDIIEQLRGDIRVEQLRENFIANKLSVYETLVKLLADKNLPRQAFEIAERSRARNFIDLLGGGQIRFSSDEDRRLYEKQQIIRSEIETVRKLLAGAETDVEKDTYGKTLKNREHELENLMIDIQLQNPQLAAMVSVPPVKTDQLISYLDPGTALLSYYLLENEIFCWILKADDAVPENRLTLVRTDANREALGKQVLDYRRIIQNIEPYEKHARELYATVFAPIAPYLEGVHTVGVSPHGALHYLSFATLLGENAFLLDQYALFYVPSAAVLEYTLSRRMPRPYRSPRVLAIGNPDLGDPILDLPFAEQEVGSIQWNFPEVTILTREKATESWVVKNFPAFDIIHIASHGEFDPVNPLLSAIKLAESDDKHFTKTGFDGNLEAGEIFGLRIDADMVFLSACQTGLGKISAGDDVVGLNRSFFYAGTHTVVSSLWRVSDVSTAMMIKTFYRLYMNRNKADCLKQAARHVKTRYPHPGYWGAFTLVGDYY